MADNGPMWLTRSEDVVAHLYFAAAEIGSATLEFGALKIPGSLSFPNSEQRTFSFFSHGEVDLESVSINPGQIVRFDYAQGESTYSFISEVLEISEAQTSAMEDSIPNAIERNERRLVRRHRVMGRSGFQVTTDRIGDRVPLPLYDVASAGLSVVVSARNNLKVGEGFVATIHVPGCEPVACRQSFATCVRSRVILSGSWPVAASPASRMAIVSGSHRRWPSWTERNARCADPKWCRPRRCDDGSGVRPLGAGRYGLGRERTASGSMVAEHDGMLVPPLTAVGGYAWDRLGVFGGLAVARVSTTVITTDAEAQSTRMAIRPSAELRYWFTETGTDTPLFFANVGAHWVIPSTTESANQASKADQAALDEAADEAAGRIGAIGGNFGVGAEVRWKNAHLGIRTDIVITRFDTSNAQTRLSSAFGREQH